MSRKKRIYNKHFYSRCMMGEFMFLVSKYSPKAKLENLITAQSLIAHKPKSQFNLSKDHWILRSHDSSKQPIDVFTTNAQFINMLKNVRSRFVQDKHKPKGFSRFSYLTKTVRRTPHDLQFIMCLAYLLVDGQAVITKDKKLKFVGLKNRKRNSKAEKSKSSK